MNYFKTSEELCCSSPFGDKVPVIFSKTLQVFYNKWELCFMGNTKSCQFFSNTPMDITKKLSKTQTLPWKNAASWKNVREFSGQKMNCFYVLKKTPKYFSNNDNFLQ